MNRNDSQGLATVARPDKSLNQHFVATSQLAPPGSAVGTALNKMIYDLNIAKGTTDPRVEFLSQVQKQILVEILKIKFDQASTSKSQQNISLSIKLKLENLDQTQLQNLDQDSTS